MNRRNGIDLSADLGIGQAVILGPHLLEHLLALEDQAVHSGVACGGLGALRLPAGGLFLGLALPFFLLPLDALALLLRLFVGLVFLFMGLLAGGAPGLAHDADHGGQHNIIKHPKQREEAAVQQADDAHGDKRPGQAPFAAAIGLFLRHWLLLQFT